MSDRTSLRFRAKTGMKMMHAYRTTTEIFSNEDYSNSKGKGSRQRRSFCGGSRLIDGAAAFAVGSSILSLQLCSGIVVQTACILTIIMALLVAYQQRKLRSLGSFRKIHNGLRRGVNRLSAENAHLHQQMGRLEWSVQRIEEVEGNLRAISESQNSSGQRLLSVLNEQKQVTAKIKEQLKKVAVQNILGVVVRSDKNKDFALSPTEIETMIVRMGMMEGVRFNEKEFRRKMAEHEGRSLMAIMEMFRSLMDKTHPDGDSIFRLCPEDLSAKNV